jgi:two-component system KDP operon response regulator KdpE
VDDNADIRLGLRLRLKANRYETLFAADALSGVEEASKHQPDLIILDLGLPGSDGFTVMESLNKIPFLTGVPIIVVSARNAFGNQKRAIEAGARAFLQKPVNDAELLAVIRQCLEEPAGRQTPALYDQGAE